MGCDSHIDAVMLSTAHLTLKRPSRKLDHKFIGPFLTQQLICDWGHRMEGGGVSEGWC